MLDLTFIHTACIALQYGVTRCVVLATACRSIPQYATSCPTAPYINTFTRPKTMVLSSYSAIST